MNAQSDRPEWADDNHLSDPRLGEGIRDQLPPWLESQAKTWRDFIAALISAQPGFVRALKVDGGYWRDPFKELHTASLATLEQRARQTRHPNNLDQFSLHDVKAILQPLPVAPEGYRFVLDESFQCEPGLVEFHQLNRWATLFIERWDKNRKGSRKIRLEPAQLRVGRDYWVALVQTTEDPQLMVLTTREQDRVNLAYPGPIKIWVQGETTAMLPVAAARLDPNWEELPYVVAYCQAANRLFSAYREGFDLGTGGSSKDDFE